MLFGRDIVTQGELHTADPYSFTSDRPWINHEWLAEVLLYLAFAAGGSLGLVALKTGIVTGAFALMLRALKRTALKVIHHDALLATAIVVMFPRIRVARPQVFSLLLFALLLHSLSAADSGKRRWLLAVPVIMALWANLHGGFLVGLGVLSLWLLVRVLQGRDAKSSGALMALGLLSVGATLLNPYGFGLWQFLWSTVGLERNIADWRPAFELGPIIWAPLLMAAGICGFMMLKAGARLDWAYKLIVAALFLGAMRVSRLDAFFGIAMVMLVAPALNGSGMHFIRPDVAVASAFRYRAVFLGVATMIVLTGASYGIKAGRCIEVPDPEVPESAAVDFFKTHGNGARVLTYFNWGEYAIWHLGSDILVSMDGRRETVYSEDLVEAHLRFYKDPPDAMALIGRLAPDYVWLPSRPVVETLVREGWHPVFRGPVSTILSRTPGLTLVNGRQNSDGARCFPNP